MGVQQTKNESLVVVVLVETRTVSKMMRMPLLLLLISCCGSGDVADGMGLVGCVTFQRAECVCLCRTLFVTNTITSPTRRNYSLW
jgi:hypothetical protein